MKPEIKVLKITPIVDQGNLRGLTGRRAAGMGSKMRPPEQFPAPRLLAYHGWGYLNAALTQITSSWADYWLISKFKRLLVDKQNAAYPPEHRRSGGLP